MNYLNIIPETIAIALLTVYLYRSVKEHRREKRLRSVSNSIRLWTMIKQDRVNTRAGIYKTRGQ
jgi:hypothetical protein